VTIGKQLLQESGPTGLLIGHFQGRLLGLQANRALSGQACGIIGRHSNFKASMWGPKLTGHFQGKPLEPQACVTGRQQSVLAMSYGSTIQRAYASACRRASKTQHQDYVCFCCFGVVLQNEWKFAGRGIQTCSSPQSCLTML